MMFNRLTLAGLLAVHTAGPVLGSSYWGQNPAYNPGQQHQYQAAHQQAHYPQQSQQHYGTQESVSTEASVSERKPELPPGWVEYFDPSSGMPYYFNENDGTTTWDRPVAQEELSQVDDTVTEEDQQQQTPQESESVQDTEEPSAAASDTPTEGNLVEEERVNTGTSQAPDDDEPTITDPSEPSRHGGQSYFDTPEGRMTVTPDGSVLTAHQRTPEPATAIPENREAPHPGWGMPEPSSPSFSGNRGSVEPQTKGPELKQPPSQQRISSDPFDNRPPFQQPGMPGSDPRMGMPGDPRAMPQQYRPPQERPPQERPPQQRPPQERQPQERQPQERLPQERQPGMNWPSMDRTSQVSSPDPRLGKALEQPLPHWGTRPPNTQQPPSAEKGPEPGKAPAGINREYQQQPQQLPFQPDAKRYMPPSQQGMPPALDGRGMPGQPNQQVPQQSSDPRSTPQRNPQQQSAPPQQQQLNQQQRPQMPPGYPGPVQPPYQQSPYGQQYGQNPQRGAAPPQQSHYYNQYSQYGQYQGYGQAAQPRNQLVPVETTAAVKGALDNAWQGILGFRNRTKESIEAAKTNVATVASQASQTISTTSIGWWGQAKNALGNFFEPGEADAPTQYSLSGNPTSQGGPPPGRGSHPGYYPQGYQGYPGQAYPPSGQGYPPQNRGYPVQGQGYPPQGQGYPPRMPGYPPQARPGAPSSQGPPRQAGQRPPEQEPGGQRYPPGYGQPPPGQGQPRWDPPNPNAQGPPGSGQRPQYPPVQSQWGGGRSVPPGPNGPPGSQQPPMRPPPEKVDNEKRADAWAHPGITGDF